jgi:hypothetical protein
LIQAPRLNNSPKGAPVSFKEEKAHEVFLKLIKKPKNLSFSCKKILFFLFLVVGPGPEAGVTVFTMIVGLASYL